MYLRKVTGSIMSHLGSMFSNEFMSDFYAGQIKQGQYMPCRV